MHVKRPTATELGTILLVGAAIALLIHRKAPPYERGFHIPAAAGTLEATVQASGPGASSSPSPRMGNCPIFPRDNIWNTPIDKLPVDPHSAAYIENIGGSTRKLHPDFATPLQTGIPYSDIPPGTRRVPITFDYAEESDLGNYPIPPDAPIEGSSDHHILLIDQQRCILYEIYDAHAKADGSWTAGSGIRMDLTGNALRPEGHGSADAAGLPILPGLVRYDEVSSGEINHALRFTIPHTQGAFIWPARHKASKETSVNVAPMGTRFRLRASFDISHFSKSNQVILTALKRYGMFLADNGGPLFLSGTADKRWDDSDLHRLNGVSADDLEAVNEADLQLLPDSARVDPTALKP